MKTIKLLSLFALLSLAWIACKNEATTETEVSEEVPTETNVVLSQADLATHCGTLSTAVSEKIKDLEALLTKTDVAEVKTAINEQLTQFRGMEKRIAEVSEKVANATDEDLAAINEETQSISKDIKMAMAKTFASPATPGQLSNQ